MSCWNKVSKQKLRIVVNSIDLFFLGFIVYPVLCPQVTRVHCRKIFFTKDDFLCLITGSVSTPNSLVKTQRYLKYHLQMNIDTNIINKRLMWQLKSWDYFYSKQLYCKYVSFLHVVTIFCVLIIVSLLSLCSLTDTQRYVFYYTPPDQKRLTPKKRSHHLKKSLQLWLLNISLQDLVLMI